MEKSPSPISIEILIVDGARKPENTAWAREKLGNEPDTKITIKRAKTPSDQSWVKSTPPLSSKAERISRDLGIRNPLKITDKKLSHSIIIMLGQDWSIPQEEKPAGSRPFSPGFLVGASFGVVPMGGLTQKGGGESGTLDEKSDFSVGATALYMPSRWIGIGGSVDYQWAVSLESYDLSGTATTINAGREIVVEPIACPQLLLHPEWSLFGKLGAGLAWFSATPPEGEKTDAVGYSLDLGGGGMWTHAPLAVTAEANYRMADVYPGILSKWELRHLQFRLGVAYRTMRGDLKR